MAIKLSFNELPKGPEKLDEGIYILTILNVVSEETASGKDAFIFEYEIDNKEQKLRDWFMINNEDGKPNNFGRKKLRTLLESAQIDIVDISPKMLQQLSKGKKLKAELRTNKNGYLEVSYDNFYRLDDSNTPALNAASTVQPDEEVVKETKEVSPNDFLEDEDI